VSGTAVVRDLNRDLEWNLPEEDAATVAGLVINAAEELPEVGQSYKIGGFGFEVLRRSQNQIISLRVTPPAASELASPS